MKNLLALFAVASLISGCATLPADVGTTYRSGHGCFVTSWGDEGSTGTILSSRSSYAFFRSLGSSEYGSIGYAAASLQVLANGTPFSEEPSRGLVHVRFVAPGKYQLDTFSFHRRSFLTPMAFQGPDIELPFTVTFEVESGKCTYLGRFLTSTESNEFTWQDRKAKDMEIAARSLPSPLRETAPSSVSPQDIPADLRSR